MSEVAVRNNVQDLVAQVRSDQFKEQIGMMLPENVPVSRFIRSFGTLALANPDIATWDRDSVFVALFKAGADGLLPDGREAAIVAYFDKKKNANVAQYLPMIGGVIKIAGEHGWSMTTRVVYANDQFDYELGLNERIEHKPAAGDRGDRVYAYAIARHRDGRPPMVEVMDAAEIDKVRAVSRASSRGPWVDWPDRMWEKSVGHRLFKRLPLDPGDKRVARMVVDAEDLGPDESAKMLYGPNAGQTFTAIEAGTEGQAIGAVPGTDVEDAGTSELVSSRSSQQAAEGEAASGDEPVTDGAPSVAPGAFPIPDKVVDEAGAMLVQDGWTVAATCKDEAGAQYVRRALSGQDDVDEALVAAMRTYATARHPELLP